MEVNI